MKVSKLGFLVVTLFILFSFLGRIFFPFGDEPDWIIRASGVMFGDHPFWSPYLWFNNLILSFSTDSSACEIIAGPKSVWGYVPLACNEEWIQSVYRWLITIFIMLPLLFIIIFREGFIKGMAILGFNRTPIEWNRRIDAVALSIIMPGMLYYLGVLAIEQLYLIVAIYIFLFWGFALPIVLIFILLVSIDFGNSIVVLFFIFSLMFFGYIRKRLGNVFFYGFALLLIIFALSVGYILLDLIMQLSFLGGDNRLEQKVTSIFNSLDGSEYGDKYPIILRPVITFMSFIFMTPSGLKVPLLYIVYFIAFLFITYKVFKGEDRENQVYWLTSIVVILFFVLLFPTYGNAKYYIFMFPFFVYVALDYFKRLSILTLFSFSSLFVFLNLILYRL